MTSTTEAGTPVETTPAEEAVHTLHEGFERVREEIDAHPDTDLEPVNVNPETVVQTVLGTIPEVVQFHPQLMALGMFDMRNARRLRDYALALGHTQNTLRAANFTPDQSLLEEMRKTRERLYADAQPLVLRGLLDGARVAAFRSGSSSHRALAFEVIGLSQVMLDDFDSIEGKTSTSREELENAREMGNQLLIAQGLKEQGPGVAAQDRLRRNKSFTLLIRAYNEVRDAVAYIRRREGDVEDITPSLYAGRGYRSDLSVRETEPEFAQEPAGASLNALASAAFSPTASAGNMPPAEAAGAAVAPGLPGSLPLTEE